MTSNLASLAVGSVMVIVGLGLWGVAVTAQQQRERALLPVPSCSPCPTCSAVTLFEGHLSPQNTPTPLSAQPILSTTPAVSTIVAPQASSIPSATSTTSTMVAPQMGSEPLPEGAIFQFEAGKAVFQKGEIPRLLAYCRELLRQPYRKLQIEGIGDEEGQKGAALGRNRGIITRMLLVEAGLDDERLVMLPPQIQASTANSGVRILLLEAGKP